MTSSPIFADRILNLAVTGSLVRIELGVSQRSEAGEAGLQFVASQSLVMPIEGFVDAFGIMDRAMKKLIETGVLKVNTQTPAAQP